jgi:hypothetical protein
MHSSHLTALKLWIIAKHYSVELGDVYRFIAYMSAVLGFFAFESRGPLSGPWILHYPVRAMTLSMVDRDGKS